MLASVLAGFSPSASRCSNSCSLHGEGNQLLPAAMAFFLVLLRLRLNGMLRLQGNLFSLLLVCNINGDAYGSDGASDLSGNHSPIHSFNSARYSSSSSAIVEGVFELNYPKQRFSSL